MMEFIDLFLLLFVLAVVGIGTIIEGIRGIGFGAIAWTSFIAAIKYGNQTDIRVAYMSVLLWAMASGFALWHRLFPYKPLNLASAISLSYVPPIVLLLLLNGHEYLGVTGLFVTWMLIDENISKRISPEISRNKTPEILVGIQILVIGLLTLSPYVIPYSLLLWWWYKLTVKRR